MIAQMFFSEAIGHIQSGFGNPFDLVCAGFSGFIRLDFSSGTAHVPFLLGMIFGFDRLRDDLEEGTAAVCRKSYRG